jgi:hypothetical protein
MDDDDEDKIIAIGGSSSSMDMINLAAGDSACDDLKRVPYAIGLDYDGNVIWSK